MLIGVAAVSLVAYTGHQALQAKDSLQQVAAGFQTLSSQLTAGDQPSARRTLLEVQRQARKAEDNTSGPGWWLAGRMPGVGPDVDAVRTVADVSQQLATGVLPGVVEATSTLQPANLRPRQGRVDLAPIERIAPAVVRADLRLRRQAARVAALDAGALAPQIGDPVRTMQQKLAYASRLSDRAARAVRLLPRMLGGHGRRTYLLMFQNNAELRSTGGIPGSFATIIADHGRVTMGRQGDASTIGKLDRPALPLTRDERALFGVKIGEYPQDVNFTPDFPRTAALARAMWQRRYHEQVDGVLSTDPVALSYLLRGTGPVTLGHGRVLTADNAVSLLLNRVYFDVPDPALQNVYFAAVAQRVFQAVASGQGSPHDVLQGLIRAADEQRLLVWSAHPEEQRLLAPTNLGGDLNPPAPHTPQVGVFLNDGTGAKMDYYLHYAVDVRSTHCEAGRQSLTVSVDLTSRVPRHTAGLPDYIFNSSVGTPRGVVRTTVSVYAPAGGYVERTAIDGADQPFARESYGPRQVAEQTVDASPGQHRRLTFEMVGGQGQTAPAALRVTPGLPGSGADGVSTSACS